MLNFLDQIAGRDKSESNLKKETSLTNGFTDILDNYKKLDRKVSDANEFQNNNSNITKDKNMKAKFNTDRKRVDKRQENSAIDSNREEDINKANKTDDKKVNKNNNTKDTEKIKDTDKDKESIDKKDKIIEELALILNIPIEEVEKILSELGLQVDDLINKVDLLEFVKEVFGVAENSELLNIEGIKDTIENIENAIDLYVDEEKNQIPNDTSIVENKDVDKENKEVTVEAETIQAGEVIDLEEMNVDIKEEPFETFINETPEIVNPKVVNPTGTGNASTETSDEKLNDEMFNMIDIDESIIQNQSIVGETTFDNVLINKTALESSFKGVSKPEIAEQILTKFKLDVGENSTAVRITLHPETLGDVSLKIATENGIVTAQFTAENETVKEIIESGFADLEQMLNEQGVEVSSLSVSVGQQNDGNENKNSFQSSGKKSSKRIENIITSQSIIEDEKVLDNYEMDSQDASVNYTA